MSQLLAELTERAKSLSADERAQLADSLLESLDESVAGELSPEWEREIERRAAEYDRGEVETIAAEDVFAEARRLAG